MQPIQWNTESILALIDTTTPKNKRLPSEARLNCDSAGNCTFAQRAIAGRQRDAGRQRAMGWVVPVCSSERTLGTVCPLMIRNVFISILKIPRVGFDLFSWPIRWISNHLKIDGAVSAIWPDDLLANGVIKVDSLTLGTFRSIGRGSARQDGYITAQGCTDILWTRCEVLS